MAFSPTLISMRQGENSVGTAFGFGRHRGGVLNMTPQEDEDDEEDDEDEYDPLSNGIDSVMWLPSLASQSTKSITAVRNVSTS